MTGRRRWHRRVNAEVDHSSKEGRDLSPVALVGSSPSGRITSWNRAAAKLLGWQAVDVIGRPLHDVLGCDAVPAPGTGPGVTRRRTAVSSDLGHLVDVELIVDREASQSSTPVEYMVAMVPVVAKPSPFEVRASPRIESWLDAARVISGVGGIVHCVAIGLVGVEAVNRGYSRSTGDAVLCEIAARLERAVGPGGHVVRVAGNQFVAVVRADAELDVEQLVALVSQPVDTRLGRVRIGCYAGSIVGDSVSGRVVLDGADSAMRRAEVRGVGAVEGSSHAGARVSRRHPRLSILLIDAVARREIAVTFQPVVELMTGRILEFEALARWTSSELGDVDTNTFIEAAEDAGLIHELGQIVLGKSLDVVQAEVLAGRWGSRRMSVNLSAVQLSHPDLVTRVAEALADRSLPGEVLQVELTETRLLPDMADAAVRLGELRQLGVRLALDDFGTGFANMSYLRDLPIDVIKIDGRFVAGVGASRAETAMIRSIVTLAAELRVDVNAARVETPAQHFALIRLGCVAAQGFLYSDARASADLHDPVRLPERRVGVGFPYPHDETGRLEALHCADILDTPPEEVYDEIVQAAVELCRTPISLVTLVDEDRQWFKAKVGLDADETGRDVAFCAHAICSEGLMEVPDAHDDERFASNPLVLGEPKIRFYAGVPLRSAVGNSYGTLCVIDTVPRALTLEQRDVLTRLARQVTALLELRESVNRLSLTNDQLELARRDRDAAEASVRHNARFDGLTDLPNRVLLAERIEAAVAACVPTGRPLAMLMCDLDDFKLVNDGLGRSAGDQLLSEVARRIRTCVRDTDTVARFGDDEFAVVIDNADCHIVAQLGTRILDAMAAPIAIGGCDGFRPSISIGVATHTPGATGDELLSNAGAAMHRAKELGGGRMCEFDGSLRTDIVDRLIIPTEFPTAVTNGELFCVHQPEVDLLTGHLLALESMVRWRHPTRGILLPDQFVPVVEATCGAGALFDQVLQLTLEAQAAWADRLGQRPLVAVNLSPRQLDDRDLADKIRSAVTRFSAPPESLRLEVTERAMSSNPMFDTLHEIHRLGVHLAIDDFGIGWSSMTRLSSFPWDLLKVDRSFIDLVGRDDNADRVVGGIISVAHSLGIRVAAEGVETANQLHRLCELGCDSVQGDVVDRPLHPQEVLQRALLAGGPGRGTGPIGWTAPSTRHATPTRHALPIRHATPT